MPRRSGVGSDIVWNLCCRQRSENMNWATIRLVILASAAFVSPGSAQDTELRNLDVSHWFCLSKPAGTATQPDEQERNLMKNRKFPGVRPLNVERLDVASFLTKVAAYDAKLKPTAEGILMQRANSNC